ncbi:MAG: DUF4389 domain-containing protein [Calditrichaeota bacterium]|nr:DUF4389 domain-containing protein [Calditrichota bacterium]
MAEPTIDYPVNLDIDYPEKLDRLSTFFRIIIIIPIFVILGLLTNGYYEKMPVENWKIIFMGGGIVFVPTLLMILFRKKYPKWWFDWNLELTKFSYRVFSYLILLRDEYPSTDEEQAIHIDIKFPDVQNELKRGMPLVKWLLAIPHYIVLWFLFVVVTVFTIISWFAILFTGKYPKGLFDFVVGVMRWGLRVQAYAFLLTTDRYPPFSMT